YGRDRRIERRLNFARGCFVVETRKRQNSATVCRASHLDVLCRCKRGGLIEIDRPELDGDLRCPARISHGRGAGNFAAHRLSRELREVSPVPVERERALESID